MPASNKFSQEEIRALIDSACNVVNSWKTTQLAGAVNQMREGLINLGCTTDEQGHVFVPQS